MTNFTTRSRTDAARRSIIVPIVAFAFSTATPFVALADAPKPTEIETLRGLLALQYPSLREGAPSFVPAAAPAQKPAAEIEGGASNEAPNKVPAI